MTLNRSIKLRNVTLSEREQARIDPRLDSLERRRQHPEPAAMLVSTAYPPQRRTEVVLRLQLGPLDGHPISHQAAETADDAVRLAVEDIERQLERTLSTQRGEPSFGVPSRRPERKHTPACDRARILTAAASIA